MGRRSVWLGTLICLAVAMSLLGGWAMESSVRVVPSIGSNWSVFLPLAVKNFATIDIHAQLVWDLLGADEDLHLIRPGGSRWDEGDCHYANTNPDWAVVGDATDDPRLDIDCITQCAGPENITLRTFDRSESHGRYTVEVHCYSDRGLGPAHPQVRLWVRGHQYSFGPVSMTDDQWWTVAYIDWPSGTVTPVGTIASQSPEVPESSGRRFPSLK